MDSLSDAAGTASSAAGSAADAAGSAASSAGNAAGSAASSASDAMVENNVTAAALQSEVLGPMSVMSTGFSDTFAQPLKAALPKTYSVGYSGAPRAFFNDLMTNQGRGVIECGTSFSAEDGTVCAYAATLSLMIAIGVIIPVLSIIYCCFFACGRMFQSCKCLGSCCGQPNCGGRKPTKNDYERPEKIGCFCCYMLFFCLVIVLGLIGFLSTNQMAADVQAVIQSLDAANAFPDTYRNEIKVELDSVRAFSESSLAGINDNLVGVSDALDRAYADYRPTLDALLTSVLALRSFVEGVTTAGQPNPCTFMMNTTVVEYTAAGGWRDNGTALPAGSNVCCANNAAGGSCVRGTHPVGLGMELAGENSRGAACKTYSVSGPNVTSTSAACACCCKCVELEMNLRASKALIPAQGAASALNKPISVDEVGQVVVKTRDGLDAAVDEFGKAFEAISQVTNIAASALGDQAAVIGASVSIWAFSWVAVILGFVGWLLKKHCCWFTAYTMGIICVLVYFIAWGVSSAVVLPFGDLCDGMPRTGESVNNWLMTFSPTSSLSGVNPLLVNLYANCLAKRGGVLWGVAGIDAENITDRFAAYDVNNTINVTTRALLLDGTRMTSGFTETKAPIVGFDSQAPLLKLVINTTALAEANSTQGNSVLADLALFDAKLAQLIDAMQSAANANAAKQDALLAATSLVSTNVTRMTNVSKASMSAISRRILATGDCTELNTMYENVRSPLCLQLAKSLDSVWFLLFLMGIVWFPLFCLICTNSKHSQHARGFSSLEDEKHSLGNDKKKKKFDAGMMDKDGKGGGEEKKKKKKKKKEGGGGAGVAPDPLGAAAPKEKKEKKEKKGDGGGAASSEALERKRKAK